MKFSVFYFSQMISIENFYLTESHQILLFCSPFLISFSSPVNAMTIMEVATIAQFFFIILPLSLSLTHSYCILSSGIFVCFVRLMLQFEGRKKNFFFMIFTFCRSCCFSPQFDLTKIWKREIAIKEDSTANSTSVESISSEMHLSWWTN